MATMAELVTLATGAGLSSSRARTAAAIAMAESGGNSSAHNTKGPDDSYGLWQINMKGSLGPARRRQLGLSRDGELLDPTTNARAMAVISQRGGNFSPWSTYTSGAYRKYLNGASAVPALSLPGIPGLPGLPDVTAPFRGFGHIVEAIDKSAAWLSNSENWLRILYVTGGVLLGTAGLVLLVKDTPPGRSATVAAKNAAKVMT